MIIETRKERYKKMNVRQKKIAEILSSNLSIAEKIKAINAL